MATTPKRIDLSLFDDNLKTLINAAAKIFPVEYTYVSAGTNPNNYEYVKILSGVHKREIYLWVDNTWGLIGADDTDIDFSSIKNPPTSYPPAVHTHVETDITNLNKYTKTETDALLLNKSNTDHTHALLHSHSNIALLNTLSQANLDLWNTVSDKATALHDHDGRYFTESEANTLLAGKSDTNHTHVQLHNHSNLPALEKLQESVADASYDLHLINDHETRLYNIENGYTEGHTHPNLVALDKITYTGAQNSIDLKAIENNTAAIGDNTTAIAGKADAVHIHVKANITDFAHTHPQSDIVDLATALAGKAASAHTHSQSDITNLITTLAAKADTTTLTGHTGNATVHVVQTDKDTWNAKEPAITKLSAFNKNYTVTVADIKMNGVGALGTSDTLPRADHVHPTDTSRAPLISPTLTGTPTAPTAVAGTNSTQLATTAFVQAALSAGGYGDMLKSIYDTDNDGVVDNAENSDTVDGLHKTDIFAFKGIVGSGYITDFNNALEVGIYTITDLTGVLNIPPDGPSYGILEVGIASQGMYKVQKFYSVRSDVNMPIWIRMGNESFWGPWERIPKFSEILKSKSAFAGDFNNCRETGMYSINDFAGCSNYPPNAYSYGTLIVFNGSATADTYAIGQMYLSHGNSEIWYRGGYGGSGWQGWTKSYNQYSISKGTANPSGGQDGDIYLQYV